jgi:hypothetical protein
MEYFLFTWKLSKDPTVVALTAGKDDNLTLFSKAEFKRGDKHGCPVMIGNANALQIHIAQTLFKFCFREQR